MNIKQGKQLHFKDRQTLKTLKQDSRGTQIGERLLNLKLVT